MNEKYLYKIINAGLMTILFYGSLTYAQEIHSQIEIKNSIVNFGFDKKKIRDSKDIDTIIIHSSHALGNDPDNLQGVIALYKKYRVTAHYIIDRKGQIIRLAPENRIAYHAGYGILPDGTKNINTRSIGIEIIYDEKSSPNEVQYKTLNGLIEDIKSRNNIKNILGHSEVDKIRKTDPWNFDWSKIKR